MALREGYGRSPRPARGSQRFSFRQYVDLIATLTQKEIKVRYKNNFLGYLWSLANPLASAFVFYFAIQVILKSNVENYVIFLVIGLFAWQWFNNYLVGSCSVLLSNGSLIKKSLFPRFVLPIALDLQDAFHYLMSVPVILGLLVYYHVPLGTQTLAGIFIVLPAQFLLLLGLGFMFSSINVFFRDVERMLMIVLNMMFYLSPVIYPIDRVPEPYRDLIWFNPMTAVIESWRGIFLDATIRWKFVGGAYVYAAIAVIAGAWVYRKLAPRFAEVI